VAEQVKVPAGAFADYAWSGRTIEYHRAQIRSALGFREATRGDEHKLSLWLAEEVCPVEFRDDRLRSAVLVRCRAERLEPPGRMDRIIGAGRAAFEGQFCEMIVGRIPARARVRLLGLLDEVGDDRGVLAELKSDPGRLGLEALVNEIAKLDRVLALPSDLFADVSEKLVASWRARAATARPSRLREITEPVRITLLAALCWSRTAEITDTLVDLLIALVQKINTRAERRVEGELVKDLRRVHGKDRLLFRIAEASVADPDSSVRSVVFPVVTEATLRDLVREAEASEIRYRQQVRTVLSSSYSSHYRRMLPKLLTTAGGRLIFHIMASLAEFERALIRDRTMAGLAAAADRGRRPGWQPH
jgi:hypothetical protein